jgi:tetratricopeptide (TPR) repeat protein
MLPADDQLWLVCIRLERRSGNEKLAESLMAKAMQACPKSGALWAEDLLTCDKYKQKGKAKAALDVCNDDPLVLVAVARLFDRLGKLRSAQRRFERALTLNPKLGDGWVHYYAMAYVHAFKEQLLLSGRSVGGAGATAGGNAKGGRAGSGSEQLLSDDEDETDTSAPATAQNHADGSASQENCNGASSGAPAAGSVTTGESAAAAAAGGSCELRGLLDQLERRVAAATPNQGELWCAVSKETRNRRLPPGAVLRLAVERVLGYAPSLHPKCT